MSKTKRKQPDWLREDDRWMRKGGKHREPSRKATKQDFLKETEDWYEYPNYRR